MKQHCTALGAFPALVACCVLAVPLAGVWYAQHPGMKPGMTHEEHLAQLQKEAELKKRGKAAMGFDQEKNAHHFRLLSTGGAIEVSTHDPTDEANLLQVRMHLQEIAREFANGNFTKPLATHGELPPGVRIMQQRKKALTFQYQETPSGGRVRITTSDARATRAVHEFLRYQIHEHATGDPLTRRNK